MDHVPGAPAYSTSDVRRQARKRADTWWTVLLVDPVAIPLVQVVANRSRVTPDQLTWMSLTLGLLAAVAFWLHPQGLLFGAVLFHLSFTLDCMDGKLARLTASGTAVGAWFDYIGDRIRIAACSVGLLGGAWAITDDPAFLWAALGVVFADMLNYMIWPVKEQSETTARTALLAAVLQALETVEIEQLRATVGVRAWQQLELPPDLAAEVGESDAGGPSSEPAWRSALLARGIRPNPVSGVEAQMFTFVLGPLVGLWSLHAMALVAAMSYGLLLLVSTLVVLRFWRQTRAVEAATARIVDRLEGSWVQ